MIKLISELFKEGDYIRIALNGPSSPIVEGYILEIHPRSIIIKENNVTISEIIEDNINCFERSIAPMKNIYDVVLSRYGIDDANDVTIGLDEILDQKDLQAVKKIEGNYSQTRKLSLNAYRALRRFRLYLLEDRSLLSRKTIRTIVNTICGSTCCGFGDTTRYLINDLFSFEESYRKIKFAVIIYLLTLCYYGSDLLDMLRGKGSIRPRRVIKKFSKHPEATVLSKVIEMSPEYRCWESIILMFQHNRNILYNLTCIMYEYDTLREASLQALKKFGIKDLRPQISFTEYASAWGRVTDTRIQEYEQNKKDITTLAEESLNIETLCPRLLSLQDIINRNGITMLDAAHINFIVCNIQPAIVRYLNTSRYSDKALCKHNVDEQISQLISGISFNPTELSVDAVLPLLGKIRTLIETSFQNIVKTSSPIVNIKLLSEETVLNENDEVPIQISVSNHKDSAPIEDVFVDVTQTEMLSIIDREDSAYNVIDGGESQIFKLKLKVGAEVIEQKATTLEVVCKYKSGSGENEITSMQSLRLYSADDFNKNGLKNPYASVAEGGPLRAGSNMFYGRDEFISNIADAIINSPSKQIIIYGQKRCGKSSVAFNLKDRLVKTGGVFCVYFSLGDILRNLTEVTFYYKILSSIQDELDNGRVNGTYENVPEFIIPSLSDFKKEDEDNPLNTFTKYMIKFKLLCKNTPGWGDKNLVVMIDEFTYLYSGIKEGEISTSIMKQWKAVTQNERAQFSVVLIGQDTVPSFKNEDYARNAFGVIQDIRLTYLKDDAARDLIVKPILDSDGKSRYIGAAVSKILEYTSTNPFYIQMFCSRLVEYMKEHKYMSVTEADVENVAESFVEGYDALTKDKFDNLINDGESKADSEFPEEEVLSVLRQIALNSKYNGYCSRSDIVALNDKEKEDKMFKSLTDREVLEKRSGEEYYKIQVKLFQEWLLRH